MIQMLQGFLSLEGIRFSFDKLTPDVVVAMLRHKESLKHLSTFPPKQLTEAQFYDQEQVPPVEDNIPEATWTTQSLLRECPKLEECWLPESALSMDEIEKVEWRCKGLKDLRIRIQGLDAAESIDRVINMLKTRRCENSQRGARLDIADEEKIGVVNSRLEGGTERAPAEDEQVYRQLALEERVVRHLIKFEKLKILWLGRPLAHL